MNATSADPAPGAGPGRSRAGSPGGSGQGGGSGSGQGSSQGGGAGSGSGGGKTERRFTGFAAAAGVAIGPVFRAVEPDIPVTQSRIAAADIAAEGARLEAAIAQSRKQLTKLRNRLAMLPEESQAEIAPLIDAYQRMIGPSRLVRGIRRRVEETLLSAESAVVAETESIAATIQAQDRKSVV